MSPTILVERSLPVPMRDGVVLYADLYLPASTAKNPGPYPTLLERTPYGKGFAETSFALFAAENGYAVVIQDTRGRWASEGDGVPFTHEKEDGLETVNWVASQPWCNGKIGMYGMSYVGYTQLAAASMQPAALKTIIPNVNFNNPYDIFFPNGSLALGAGVSWNLLAGAQMAILREPITEAQKAPLWAQFITSVNRLSQRELFNHLPLTGLPLIGHNQIAPHFSEFLNNSANPNFWEAMRCPLENITLPALHIGGWYDMFIANTLRSFAQLTAQSKAPQKMLIGPWLHGSYDGLVGEVDFGLQSWAMMVLPEEIQLRWFDHWLKGKSNGILEEPPIRLFVMGANIWRDEQEWPLKRTQYLPYYLHSQGAANSLNGDGSLSPLPPQDEPVDSFLYDPRNPVPTRGGGLCCWNPALPGGAFDQRPVEARPDVLVYTTPPFEQDMEVTGPLQVNLWAATSAPSTDFTAKLVDVGPCGYARNIQDGIINVTHQHPAPLEAGRPYQLMLDLAATSNVFKAGHSLRLEISSSNFPRFARNLNTGQPVESSETAMQAAFQTIFHDTAHPSHILLPVIPQ